MTALRKLRASEWVLVAFFSYSAAITPFFRDRHPGFLPLAIAIAVFLLLLWTARFNYARDWIPIALTLVAFREMELFVPKAYDRALESGLMTLDVAVLRHVHLDLLAPYLELCYLLVYGVPAYCMALIYIQHRRAACDRFLLSYLGGTLTAYALFPFFPSRPPRYAFPNAFPAPDNLLHRLNTDLLGAATIHTSVFPSAHVSSVFAAAWALFAIFPDRKRYGYIALIYAVSVAIGTVVGRYHYAADVLAGFAVSFVGLFLLTRSREID